MIRIGKSFASALAVSFLACNTSATKQESGANATADRAAIDKENAAFVAAMRASDCNGLMSMLADDAVFAPPHAQTATGRDGVRAWCEPIFSQMKTRSVIVSDRDVIVSGDWAIETGMFDWTLAGAAGGADVNDKGRFIAIYHRQADGSWKLTRDMWNSSLPLQSAASPKV